VRVRAPPRPEAPCPAPPSSADALARLFQLLAKLQHQRRVSVEGDDVTARQARVATLPEQRERAHQLQQVVAAWLVVVEADQLGVPPAGAGVGGWGWGWGAKGGGWHG
jgi:hypothetical protein